MRHQSTVVSTNSHVIMKILTRGRADGCANAKANLQRARKLSGLRGRHITVRENVDKQ